MAEIIHGVRKAKLQRIKDFLLKEFGDELRKEIRKEITQDEIEKLLPKAKAKVLKDELPRLRLQIEKENEVKFQLILRDYLDGFFSEFIPRREETIAEFFIEFQNELGFQNCKIMHTHYDCLCTRNGRDVRIEFERRSVDFFTHGHDETKIDLIVCWVDNIPDSHNKNIHEINIPILELSLELPKIIERLRCEVEKK